MTVQGWKVPYSWYSCTPKLGSFLNMCSHIYRKKKLFKKDTAMSCLLHVNKATNCKKSVKEGKEKLFVIKQKRKYFLYRKTSETPERYLSCDFTCRPCEDWCWVMWWNGSQNEVLRTWALPHSAPSIWIICGLVNTPCVAYNDHVKAGKNLGALCVRWHTVSFFSCYMSGAIKSKGVWSWETE